MSGYLKVQDVPEPQYIVVVVHTEYEQSVYLFVSLEKAEAEAKEWIDKHAEVYLAKLQQPRQ